MKNKKLCDDDDGCKKNVSSAMTTSVFMVMAKQYVYISWVHYTCQWYANENNALLPPSPAALHSSFSSPSRQCEREEKKMRKKI